MKKTFADKNIYSFNTHVNAHTKNIYSITNSQHIDNIVPFDNSVSK